MDSKITKISMGFNDRSGKGLLQYELTDLHDEGFDKFELPFDPVEYTPLDFKMEIFDDQNNRETVDWDFFKFLRESDGNEGDEDPRIRKYKQLQNDSPILRGLNKSFWLTDKYKGKAFPKLSYADITERDMFGSDEITEQMLFSPKCGVWSGSGLRKLSMRVDDMIMDRRVRGFKQKGILYWTKVDSQPIVFLQDKHVVYHPTEKQDNKYHDEYYVYCDTDQLGEAIANNTESPEPQFFGRFELHFEDETRKESWAFPVNIIVLDSSKKRLLNEDDFVSLDFGTSATCAAYQKDGNFQLLRLSGTNKSQEEKEKLESASEYENPTNLMIFNWDEIWQQWNEENQGMPLLTTKFENISERNSDYDSGHSVEKVYHATDDPASVRKMGAIISELKTIPYLLSKGKSIRFTPLNDQNLNPVDVIADGKESKHKFNPIKLYGYLISRVINQPRENRYYTKFKVTYPVKFEPEIKKKIARSLAEGIIMALPKPVREEINPEDCVEMEHSEPVASIGACIPDQLNYREDDDENRPVLFSVFDLGGGTWDTSYGILRLPQTEEEEAINEEAVVQILDTGGDEKMGAERLLHKLAFFIYKDNKDEMVSKSIPFIMPEGEQLPAGINLKFLSDAGGKAPEANVHAMIEQIARPYFQAEDSVVDKIFEHKDKMLDADGKIKIMLKNMDGVDVEVNLSLEKLEDYLENELIADLVKRYKNEMQDTLKSNEKILEDLGLLEEEKHVNADEKGEDPSGQETEAKQGTLDKVLILLGGNASKQRYLERKMRAIFKDNEIKRIGAPVEGEEETHLSQRITAKTAVAIGQLKFMLLNIPVVGPSKNKTVMQYNVGIKKSLSNKFSPILKKSDHSREWVRANKILQNDMTALYFTSSSAENVRNEELNLLKEKVAVDDPLKRTLYIRIYPFKNNAIEYRLGANDEKFSPDEDYDESKVLLLEEKIK